MDLPSSLLRSGTGFGLTVAQVKAERRGMLAFLGRILKQAHSSWC